MWLDFPDKDRTTLRMKPYNKLNGYSKTPTLNFDQSHPHIERCHPQQKKSQFGLQ
jgi:hypothetical protein